MNFFDLHCDTITACMESGQSLFDNSLHLSLRRGEFESWAQVFAVFVPDGVDGAASAQYFDRACEFFFSEIEKNSERIALCKTRDDMRRSLSSGRCAAILAMENSAAVVSAERLEELFERGLRLITITWNGANAAGGGVSSGGGLTKWGGELVKLAEELGIVVDASHLSENSFWDLARIARKPFAASHSNAGAVYDCRRSLSDEQIKFIVGAGGLIGLNFYREFLGGAGGVQELLKHALHMLSLGAQDALAIGTDFDGSEISPRLGGIEHIGDVREQFVLSGIDEELCEKIFFQNARNFFERVLQ